MAEISQRRSVSRSQYAAGVHEQAERVGPEAVIAQPIRLDRILEVLYPVLRLAAVHVPVVNTQGVLGPGRDDKPRIRAFAEGFGFVDHATWLRPRPRLVGRLTG